MPGWSTQSHALQPLSMLTPPDTSQHMQAVPAAARQRAVALTAQLFQNAAAPAAVRLIQAFHLTGADLQPALNLDKALAELLADRRSVKHAMAVLLAFPEKAQGLDTKDLFDRILGAGQGRAGTDLCRSLPHEAQARLSAANDDACCVRPPSVCWVKRRSVPS